MARYPRLNSWLIFKRKNEYEYEVIDWLTENEYTMGVDAAHFARKLNGKRNPFQIDTKLSRHDVQEILNKLDELGLIRHNNILLKEFGTIFYTLWIPKRTRRLVSIAKVFTLLLNLLWLPVLILGVLSFLHSDRLGGEEFYLLGSIGGIIIGMFLHELGHLCSGLAYGAKVFEMGVMIDSFIPGAYVLLDADNVLSKKHRVAINAAGVKANLILAGVCLLTARLFPMAGMPLLCAAINNVLLSLINILFVSGLDGTSIISEYLGIPQVVSFTRGLIFNRKRRNRIVAKGINGYVTLAVGLIIQSIQIALPLLIAINILEVIECFM